MFLKTPKLVMVKRETVFTATAIFRVSGRNSRHRFALAAWRDRDSAPSELGAHLGKRSLACIVPGTHSGRVGIRSRGADSSDLCVVRAALSLRMAVSGCGCVAAFFSRRQCSCLDGIARPGSILSRRLAFWTKKVEDWPTDDLEAQRARLRAVKQERNSPDLGAERLTPCPSCASSSEDRPIRRVFGV